MQPEPTIDEVTEFVKIVDDIPQKDIDAIVSLFGSVPQEILWKATIKEGIPHNMFLGPPTSNCYHCNARLQAHNHPCSVICFTVEGPIPATKLTLRCKKCHINYRYEQYGNQLIGYQYYSTPRPLVHASQVVYVDRSYCAHMVASG